MPLLSRLFGRKHQDDDKSPSAEWPLGAQPVGAQPPGGHSVGTAPVVPDQPPANDSDLESRNASSLSEVWEETAVDDAAHPLAENEPAQVPGRPNQEDGDGRFETQAMPLEAGEGRLEVLGTDDTHDVSSNGSVAVAETAPEAFSTYAHEPDQAIDPPVGESSNSLGPLSKESADAFAASIEPFGARPLETSDPFAAPEATFNALAAASADAFEMPVEQIADPFGTPHNEPPESAAQDSSAPTGTLFKSQTTRSNPFMKLVAEAHEVTEASESDGRSKEVSAQPSISGGKHLDLMQPAPTQDATRLTSDAARLTTFAVPPAGMEANRLIGGKEDDLVPLIPDTEADEADEAANTAEIDESGIAEAAVASLKGSCDFLVARVKKLSAQQDGTRVVAGLIALVGELDARYALDMGIRRKNGVEELLIDVRGRMAEGDRFVLESLENGRGGLTADAFLRDLKTIAPSDRPRMLGHYVVILTFMIKHVLHQYLRSLEEDQTRSYEISYHLDYLVEGVRDMLMSKVTAGAS